MEGLIWVNQNLHSNVLFNHIVKIITLLGDMGIIWIALAICLLCFKKTRLSAVVMLVSLAVGFLINDFVLKQLFNRPRPFEVNGEFVTFLNSIKLPLPFGNSFPSGHTFSSFNCATILTCFSKKSGWLVYPLASAIALSRIFLCVHYPTDVLVGAILGVLTAIAVYAIYKKVCAILKAKQRQKVRQ